ncbi:hypothetical protein [Kitasatospora sp. NPDC090091]|uniref:hypothetical protein n=1 Tax=Kitasatospora sp. NPDC090091 TaxID=3364081 RepID=UPI00381832DF
MSENRTVVAVAEPNALPLRRRVAAPVLATVPSRAVRRDRAVARDEAWSEDEPERIAAAAEPGDELALRTRAAHCRIAVQYVD